MNNVLAKVPSVFKWKPLLVLGVSLSMYFVLPESCPHEAKKMAVIFVLAALLWAFELVPLYATSLLVILLEIFFLGSSSGEWPLKFEDYRIFLNPFSSPVMILFFGGFVLAEAFRRHAIDRLLASHLLKRFGSHPYSVLLGFMLVTAFLSMWISNTATTALMLAMILPLLDKLDSDDLYRKGLVLAVAFGANIGGTMTPIGTPPNAIAIGMLAEQGIVIDFSRWILLAGPLGIILMLISSLILYPVFPSKNKVFEVHVDRPAQLDIKAKFVLAISAVVIALWLTGGLHAIPSSVIALFGVGLLAVSGLIDQQDIKRINWDILILMWGGLALGEGMRLTGLADWIVGLPLFSQGDLLLFILFPLLSVFLSTFMSNTATVNILIPIVVSMTHLDYIPLACMVAFASSFDIPLPIATPPMAMAYGTGQLRVKDMLKVGVLICLIANILLFINFKWIAIGLLSKWYG